MGPLAARAIADALAGNQEQARVLPGPRLYDPARVDISEREDVQEEPAVQPLDEETARMLMQRVQEAYARRKKKPKTSMAKTQTEPPPVRALEGRQRFDIAELLRNVQVDISLAELVDISHRAKSQLIRAIAVPRPAEKGKNRAGLADPVKSVIRVQVSDRGRDKAPGEKTLGYVTAYVNGVPTTRAMIDGGALVDLISPEFARRVQATILPVEVPWKLRMASDEVQEVHEMATVVVVIGGIKTLVTACMTGCGEPYCEGRIYQS